MKNDFTHKQLKFTNSDPGFNDIHYKLVNKLLDVDVELFH